MAPIHTLQRLAAALFLRRLNEGVRDAQAHRR